MNLNTYIYNPFRNNSNSSTYFGKITVFQNENKYWEKHHWFPSLQISMMAGLIEDCWSLTSISASSLLQSSMSCSLWKIALHTCTRMKGRKPNNTNIMKIALALQDPLKGPQKPPCVPRPPFENRHPRFFLGSPEGPFLCPWVPCFTAFLV